MITIHEPVPGTKFNVPAVRNISGNNTEIPKMQSDPRRKPNKPKANIRVRQRSASFQPIFPK